ncbi:hypothetical protein CAFEA_08015 [Corynebacterium afermentans subsp. afermentans]|uniref:NPCBM/NEW2 domain-containing protein n=1 Tax=Corynebacterium afermentans TaxID=38286 RepID=A0A9X8R6H6_9CORY|nr:hypothetical protein [Corynebacterium afermentans]OAA16657.1 hypothetical protein Caferm_03830 [Corynebacterium afermentans subsp. afermentans]WJY57190.1 hypothetical protein CAFEA_08015 [Corynebacterium afermentans subsp. afermentans]SIQ70365.1 hypothetical protein SAMN05421802_1264 [Corynebacterium afermentans]
MYDFRDINKLLNNVENLIPQIVAAIVALTALIGTVAGLAQNGSSINPGNGGNSVVGNAPSNNTDSNLNPSPKLAQEKLLIPNGRKDVSYKYFDQGVEVKVGDKVFTDSARAKNINSYDINITRSLSKEFRRATFTAVWDENVVSNRKEGPVRVYVNGNLAQSKIVQKGSAVDFNIPVTNIDTLRIEVDPNNGGLSIVNGVLYR